MAGAVADRVWRDSSPESIDADLAALWREIGQSDVTTARAVMSNLIVVRAPSGDRTALSAIAADLPLDDVAARHPSRTIVLEHCDENRPSAPFAVAVGIVTFGPPQARYAVEQIVVRSACPEPSLLSILRRLVRGDVPTTVWWTEDLSDRPPFDPLLTVGRQLLYDSRGWGDLQRGLAAILPLVDNGRVDLADLNWRRLAPLRRALVHAHGPVKGDRWRDARIVVGHAASETAAASLIAGWLRGERHGDPLEITMERVATSDLAPTLTVAAGGVTAALTSRAVHLSSASAPPLVVAVPQESHAEAIAAELRSLSPDRTLLSALRALRT
jgi:glucose-6-phosphate dehydrogenase assembly protein OpcA